MGANADDAPTELETTVVRPSPEQMADELVRQDAIKLVTLPAKGLWGFVTNTNPWHVNPPGDDSIESAMLPGPWGAGAKGVGVGLTLLRDIKRVEESYETISSMPLSAQRFLSSGRETQVYLGYRDGVEVYCGISCNITARQIQHGAKYKLDPMSPMMPFRGQARAIEQAMINRNPQFKNIRNSISPTHEYYNDVVRWGESWLKSNGF